MVAVVDDQLGIFLQITEFLKKLRKEFHNDSSVEITLVSKDNFLLFTPMLPEVASGMIETRHIVTPVKSFCRKAKFYEANLESIDLDNKRRGKLMADIAKENKVEHLVYSSVANADKNTF
ncbi:MAG TPA: hypothetical protein VFJ05_03900 [Nitrososphaeraceae archaeon]|nr:hypothetical protein [Nitrososphaeraceae archaeon]